MKPKDETKMLGTKLSIAEHTLAKACPGASRMDSLREGAKTGKVSSERERGLARCVRPLE
jgi:hypothetical protein